MILYHQTSKVFDQFDLSRARLGAFGVGVYFYTKKPSDSDVHGVVCDVKPHNPIMEDKTTVPSEKWDMMCRSVENLVLRESGNEIRIPSLGNSGIRNFRILCDIYSGNVENPDWPEFLSEFRHITGYDGYIAHPFVMCFDADEIAIVGRF